MLKPLPEVVVVVVSPLMYLSPFYFESQKLRRGEAKMKVPDEMGDITKQVFHSASGLALRFLYVPEKDKDLVMLERIQITQQLMHMVELGNWKWKVLRLLKSYSALTS